MHPEYHQYPLHQERPAPHKKSSKWPWILLGVGIFVLLSCVILSAVMVGALGKEVDNQIEHGNTELKSHVKIDSCKTNSIGFAEVTFTVVNASDSNQDYWVQFAINDSAGNRLSEAHGVVNNLAAGKTAAQQKTVGGEVSGRFTCVVERVN